MQAVVIKKPGGPEVLELVDRPLPVPQKGEIRVLVKAVGVNRADILQRTGSYPAPEGWPADIPGLEYSGVVDQLGLESSGFSQGDRVFGLVGGGAYAQYVIVNARELSKIPGHLSFEEAAAVPEAFITAYDAMVSQCRLGSGEFVLINAAASGVGTAALQIAKAIGAETIGTSRSAEKLKKVEGLGLDHAIAVKDGKFSQEVMRITNGRGADVIVELVGGSYLNEGLKAAAPRGRLILVGLLDGRHVETDLALILGKRLEVKGTTLRARPLEEKIQVTNSFNKHVIPLLQRGLLKPIVDRVMPLSQVAQAHLYMEQNLSIGKIVLKIN